MVVALSFLNANWTYLGLLKGFWCEKLNAIAPNSLQVQCVVQCTLCKRTYRDFHTQGGLSTGLMQDQHRKPGLSINFTSAYVLIYCNFLHVENKNWCLIKPEFFISSKKMLIPSSSFWDVNTPNGYNYMISDVNRKNVARLHTYNLVSAIYWLAISGSIRDKIQRTAFIASLRYIR